MFVQEKHLEISLEKIEATASRIISDAKPLTLEEAKSILAAVGPSSPLSPEDAGRFAVTDKQAVISLLHAKAQEVKEKVFGKRIVLFAPLYLSSRCHNNCLYCGFRVENREIDRRTLSPEEAAHQAQILSRKGYRRLLLVCGESYESGPVDYISSIAREIYKKTDIRILHLNAAPMEVDELKAIKKEGIGVYQVFQETYHRETYKKMHPSGKKADYFYRLSCMDRAIQAGFDDVGTGALLGLYDWRFECVATVVHGHYLREKYGTYPHTISVPRLKPARGAAITKPPHPVSDDDFLKIVSLYRLCCPSSGVVISTREPASLRERSLSCGASQISAGSSTSPGGYDEKNGNREEGNGQFYIDDKRSITEIMSRIIELGLVPSLCTSCYRSGRTGSRFTSIATAGKMGEFCEPNALLTLLEFAVEKKDRELKKFCEKLAEEATKNLSEKTLRLFREKLQKTLEGARDERL